MKDEYMIVERCPTVEEYKKLRKAVKWIAIDDEAIKKGLENSLFAVCILYNNEVIGCGRVIGDGGILYSRCHRFTRIPRKRNWKTNHESNF